MIDKSSLLKSHGSLYLEFIPKDGLFHKMLLLSLMGFLTGWCNLKASQPIFYEIECNMYMMYMFNLFYVCINLVDVDSTVIPNSKQISHYVFYEQISLN